MTTTSLRGAAQLPGLVIAVLALLTAVSPLSTDMYLPAFPQMATDLVASATGIQLTLTTFLVGLALGQLVIGPLSDGTGRRKPLIVGARSASWPASPLPSRPPLNSSSWHASSRASAALPA